MVSDALFDSKGFKVISDDYYLCLGLKLNESNKTLIDTQNSNTILNIDNTESRILILEREVNYWLLHSMQTLVEEDKLDAENDYQYEPFRNSIFMLFGIFAYIEKMEEYRTKITIIHTEQRNSIHKKIIIFLCKSLGCENNKNTNLSSSKLLISGMKRIFPEELQGISNTKLNDIIRHTRHKMMHQAMIGDDILLNLGFDDPIKYIHNDHLTKELRINPIKIYNKIAEDFTTYIELLRGNEDEELINSFNRNFQEVYNKEINILTGSDQ